MGAGGSGHCTRRRPRRKTIGELFGRSRAYGTASNGVADPSTAAPSGAHDAIRVRVFVSVAADTQWEARQGGSARSKQRIPRARRVFPASEPCGGVAVPDMG